MAKLIYLCARPGVNLPFSGKDLENLSAALCPDNIEPRPPRILEGDGTLIGVFNPVPELPVQGCSVCLGALFDNKPDWWRPLARVPDGSYALFRGDDSTVELVSDMVASRTIWYVKTDDIFIAATSQRAIVACLGSYEPNESVYPWMLSSGNLGPGLSWDSRIRCVPNDARLILDKRSWEIKLFRTPVEFKALDLPAEEHEYRLRKAIEETFTHVNIDSDHWTLPLSGGYDSRAIFLMLKDRPGLKTITWGLRSALKDQRGDALVARELAGKYQVQHEYFETDLSDEPVETIFQRFLVAGEGRTDHISGYMDGFAIWKHLYESGCHGVIRGDEAFGCYAVRDSSQVYKNMGMRVVSDYRNLGWLQDAMQRIPQKHPVELTQRADESLASWRDRLSTEFKTPVVFAALSDLKLAYTELVNPLLSRRIIKAVRGLPDSLRTEKSLFRSIVEEMEPDHHFAENPAIQGRRHILGEDRVREAIHRRLEEAALGEDISASIARNVLHRMHNPQRAEKFMNMTIWSKLRGAAGRIGMGRYFEILDPVSLSLRAYILLEMQDRLQKDAAFLQIN